MSADFSYLLKVVRLLDEIGIEAIIVGNSASILNQVPVFTEDLDFFVRDTPLIRKRIREFADRLKAESRPEPIGLLTDAVRVRSGDVPIDFLFAIGGEPKFESVRSRAWRHPQGGRRVWVASLEDVIASKKAANRPKDQAALLILEQTLAVKKAAGDMAAEHPVAYRVRSKGEHARTWKRNGR